MRFGRVFLELSDNAGPRREALPMAFACGAGAQSPEADSLIQLARVHLPPLYGRDHASEKTSVLVLHSVPLLYRLTVMMIDRG